VTYLLDTNAFSEITKPRPDPGFSDWFARTYPEDLYLSALSVGEVRRGIALLPIGQRRDILDQATRKLQSLFGVRILPVDVHVADLWGEFAARQRRAGLVIGAVDELLAATSLVHDLTLVTRNTRHFEATGCRVLCPWTH
jgi:predicted nucleic acid-binding protein